MAGCITVQIQQRSRTPIFRVTHDTVGVKFDSVFGATKLPGDVLAWYYPAYYPVYKIVVSDLQALGRYHKVDLQFSEKTQEHLERISQYDDHIAKARLPENFEFKTKPYQHQLDGLVHAIYSLRAALFYDCGTGKTKIIIDWQRATGCYPVIVCPRIALHVWNKEAAIHGIDQEFMLVDGATIKKKRQQIDAAKDYTGMVVTYDTLRRHYEYIAEAVPFNAIVADESQKIKQTKSQRTKVALEMAKGAYRRIIMSGTPSLGDPRDIYPQYRFLAAYFMPWNAWRFKKIFCTVSPHNDKIVTGFKNLDLLNRRIGLVSIRRKKEECLDLPKRTIQDLDFALKPAQKKLYNELARTVKEAFGADLVTVVNALVNQDIAKGVSKVGDAIINIPHAAALVNKLIQVSCGFIMKQKVGTDPCSGCQYLDTCVHADPAIRPWTPRCFRWRHIKEEQVAVRADVERGDLEGPVEARIAEVNDMGPPPVIFPERLDSAKAHVLADLLDTLLTEKTNKIIIWGQYIEELNIIEETVSDTKVGYIRVDGSNTDKSKEFEQQFNNDPSCRVWIGQVATGVAITLNSAQYTVYFSVPWNYEHYAQSIDRNHRVGQRSNVTVYRLLAPGVDKHIAEALVAKHEVAQALIDKESTTSKVGRPITKVREV